MSSTPVVIKLECHSKEAQTNNVRSKLSEILKVYFKTCSQKKYCDNRNIGPFKYRFRLSTFLINYSIDDINGLIMSAAHISGEHARYPRNGFRKGERAGRRGRREVNKNATAHHEEGLIRKLASAKWPPSFS
jgi:hypothetical protein